MKIVIDLSDKYTITKSGLNEGFIRKKPKRQKIQITNIKQSKKGLNNMQKKIEFAYEINQKMAKLFAQKSKSKLQISKEKRNFAGQLLTKNQKIFLDKKGLEAFLTKYPQFA